MEKESLNHDTLRILRAIIKISSAFNNLDELTDSKYLKYKFKVESKKWLKYMEMHTEEAMKSLTEENDSLLVDVYTHFDESIKIEGVDEDKANVITFYAKIKSALNDIEKLDDKKNFYSMFISYVNKKILKVMDKQFVAILQTKDDKGIGLQEMIGFYDDFAEKIMNYIEQEDELGKLDKKRNNKRGKSKGEQL